MSASEIRAMARALLDLCKMKKLTIATAESCTGGLVCASLVDIPGSSAVVTTGFITYSNEAKHELLGVSSQTLENFGAVSREAAVSMANGALKKAKSGLSVAVTGIAGPGGATPGKPVGLVHLAVASRDGRVVTREKRFGAIGRTAVRMRSVVEALKMLTELARGPAKVVKLKRPAPGAGRSRPRASRTLRQSGGTRRRTSRP
ncbi:nicotinamide-nucleotide amidohydrolase family protein [Bradyrhizobium sp. LHD-71]|uniref:CinA family protein n=1 Tax=Bradyrhizobium sp. LHD-71 TaxID=3072141 RepID=UPI00280D6852|nr:nicotinamide-nucleotide amidohydrolase family protein [Bradyrhizobium sp. LHD-71]MDQ8730077.1 nicotinamide-nucleotide amidohydrolase family protein [Bradyrhizobium sp. LHD-71]